MFVRLVRILIILSVLSTGSCDHGAGRASEFKERGRAVAMLYSAEKYMEAADAATALAEDFPERVEAQYIAALYLAKKFQLIDGHPYSRESLEKINKYLDRGLRIGADDVELNWGVAQLYAELSMPERAMAIFRKYKSDSGFMKSPAHIDLFPSFAYLIADSGDANGAIEVLDTALAMNAGDDILAQEKIRILARFFDYSRMRFFASEYQTKFGFNAPIQFQVCESFKKMGEDDNSSVCFDELLSNPELNDEDRSFITEHVQEAQESK